MKNLLFTIGIAALLTSCGYNKQEQMLYDYVNGNVQKLFNVDVKELNFKVKDIKKVKEITAADSLAILEPYFEKEKEKAIKNAKDRIDELQKEAGHQEYLLTTPDYKEYEDLAKVAKQLIESHKKETELRLKLIEHYNSDCKSTELEPLANLINEYKTMGNKKLSDVYEATYSIKNPLLKAEQTRTNTYYTNREGTKIIDEKSEE